MMKEPNPLGIVNLQAEVEPYLMANADGIAGVDILDNAVSERNDKCKESGV